MAMKKKTYNNVLKYGWEITTIFLLRVERKSGFKKDMLPARKITWSITNYIKTEMERNVRFYVKFKRKIQFNLQIYSNI